MGMCYISAPIDYADGVVPWGALEKLAADIGYTSFVPNRAYGSYEQDPASVFNMCLHVLSVCDAMIVWFPPDAVSIGVPIEPQNW